jgi:hypothetical protein
MCLRQARDEEVDISRTLQNLAVYPAGVVGNIRHYLLAHLVVLENTVVGGTGVKCDNFDLNLPILISNEEIQKHLEHLQEMLWLDQQAKMIKAEGSTVLETTNNIVYLTFQFFMKKCWLRTHLLKNTSTHT